METCALSIKEERGVPIIFIKGYLNCESGEELNSLADKLLQQEKVRFVIDFSECNLINSLGIAAILELTLITQEDYQGKIIFSKLNSLMIEVFELAAILPNVETAPTWQEAISNLLK